MHSIHDDQIPREIDAETGLPIGPRVDPGPARRPVPVALDGRYCRLEPIDPVRHRDDLFVASSPPDAKRRFRYLFEEPPASLADMDAWLAKAVASSDPLVFAVIDKRTGRCEGRQTLMRITPEQRCIETGSIYWGPAISRSQVSTEANYLFAKHVFDDLGYRRFEWKCDALNAPSRAAAERFGFTYEGHFRRAVIVKGRSRDTTWFAMVDDDWPALKAAYERWLDPANFDAAGKQRTRLADLTAAALGRTP
ncbi:MAG: GNAT family protein [Hyphomicrobiaceae bacterium]|nr:GNAT family protein [Hyphomicrobiaceae bacterium]